MKSHILFILLLVFSLSDLSGQSFSLCSIPNDLDQAQIHLISNDLSIQIESNGDIYKYIEKLMSTVNLPMNFHVYECSQINCKTKNNAFAAMNNNGTRFIVYDESWLKKLQKGTNNIEILTVLAHEIGHHLSAHTLALDKINNEKAIATCNPRSKEFNENICNSKYKADYENYLYNLRMNELEADRFAGYIMKMYGADLSQIQSFFKKIFSEHDDSNSTHPSLNKRLNAIEQGFSIAIKNTKSNNTEINLKEIKGNPIEIIINEITDFEKYQIIEKLTRTIINKPISHINTFSEYEINANGSYKGNPLVLKKTQEYLSNSSVIWELDNEKEYFKVFNIHICFEYNKKINYSPYPAIHIKDGVLKILLFERKNPVVIYKSSFEEAKISFDEIETIFIEIFDNGFRRAIKKYEEE